MLPTIALFASSRRDGNTGRLMDSVAERLEIDIVDLARKRISPYDYEHRNRSDDFEPLIQRVLDHEQIIFGSRPASLAASSLWRRRKRGESTS